MASVSFVRAFLRLSRPTFLAGGAAAVGLGTALAVYAHRGVVNWSAWLTMQLTVTALQLMTHYSNEYFDRDADAHARRTQFSGGSGVLVEGLFAPWIALAAALIALGCGLGGVAVLAAKGHGQAAFLGLVIALLAWTYSAKPFRFLTRGLGELETASIVGILVPLGGAAAQSLPISPATFVATLPAAAAMFVMMLAVEVPDAAADAVAGKRNLVVRFAAAVPALASIAIVLVYAGVGLAILSGAPRAIGWLSLVTIPPALSLAHSFSRLAAAPTETLALRRSGIAARGVAFFFLVSFEELLGFLVPL